MSLDESYSILKFSRTILAYHLECDITSTIRILLLQSNFLTKAMYNIVLTK